VRISDEPAMGHHVLLNLYDCDESRLSDLAGFEGFADSLLPGCNAQVLNRLGHQFSGMGDGFTSLYLLTTSHFSVHSWPEYCSAAVDIFTCGAVDTDEIVKKIVMYFRSSRHSLSDVLR
jgi:S-adenosylmethionine decarboxylase proenzyme